MGNNLDDALNLYYLGGLDSVRGTPEGALSGRKALYANVELRHASLRFDNIWLQGVVFSDYGAAHHDWWDIGDNGVLSAGGGFRIIVPHVSRMVFRLDFARDFNHQVNGISAGMNQFFDPYRPL